MSPAFPLKRTLSFGLGFCRKVFFQIGELVVFGVPFRVSLFPPFCFLAELSRLKVRIAQIEFLGQSAEILMGYSLVQLAQFLKQKIELDSKCTFCSPRKLADPGVWLARTFNLINVVESRPRFKMPKLSTMDFWSKYSSKAMKLSVLKRYLGFHQFYFFLLLF